MSETPLLTARDLRVARPGDDGPVAVLDGVDLTLSEPARWRTRVALDRDISRLSVGQASRIALLRVLLTRPEVLLLDEPDASLDDSSAEQVARMTAQFAADGGAVLRISHVRADASARARYHLADGKLTEVSL
ncbi:MAG: ABC transporter ATP-binding protein [Coriobacteriia bacterium]|nr:ABC transporter ATP-binding protein [Coriobacteriia bacterium]